MTNTNPNTTSIGRGRRAPAKAGGGLKYLVTAATVAVVVGGWGLIAEPAVAPQALANAGLPQAPLAQVQAPAQAPANTTAPTLTTAPANKPQQPAQVTTNAGLRAVVPAGQQFVPDRAGKRRGRDAKGNG